MTVHIISGSFASISESILAQPTINFLIVSFVAIVFYIVFTSLFLVAKTVLTETESLGAAIKMM